MSADPILLLSYLAGSVLERNYGDEGLVVPLAAELYSSVHESVKGMVLAHSHILVGIVHCTPLAHDNVAGLDYFAAEFLEAETFAMRLTTVL